MVEYDFLRAIGDLTVTFRQFPLPVIIVDAGFQPCWSNDLARNTFSHLTSPAGLHRVLEEYDLAQIRSRVQAGGECVLGDILPLNGMSMSISPVVREGDFIGMTLMLMESVQALGAADAYKVSHAAHSIAHGVRQAVGEMFSAMDVAALKSDQVEMDWIKPNLAQISYYGYRALRIADNVAEYAYLQNGGEPLLEAVNLVALLEDLERPLQEMAQTVGAELQVKFPDRPIQVRGDWPRLELALLNVLHNSLYFAGVGNRIVLQLEESSGMAEILVEDQGFGMPPHILERACEPYFSYSHGAERKTTGLGLSLARALCEAHGGSLQIASQEGKGTSVVLRLPEGGFSTPVTLAQPRLPEQLGDRFSRLYTVLGDLPAGPFRG